MTLAGFSQRGSQLIFFSLHTCFKHHAFYDFTFSYFVCSFSHFSLIPFLTALLALTPLHSKEEKKKEKYAETVTEK